LTKLLFGDTILKSIEERKQLIKKLKKADEEYEKMIDLAKKESNKIITKANKKKETMLNEGKIIAEEERKKILDIAISKGEIIMQDAESKGKKMLKELEGGRTKAVTDTTQVVVNKLLNTHEELKKKYITTITDELKREKVQKSKKIKG
jgi:vacuolar-type H+-ATPase subunit H